MLIAKTKADHLTAVSGKLKSALVPELYKIQYDEWVSTNSTSRLKIIKSLISDHKDKNKTNWVIRSSHFSEDQENHSNAGKFSSFVNVQFSDIQLAISNVFDSYGALKDGSEVLIQPYIQDTKLSGVAFTHDQDTGAPYRIFNWAEGSDTTAITSGATSGKVFIKSPASLIVDEHIGAVDYLLDELMELLPCNSLEIEYALSQDNQLILFQVRPLILANPVMPVEDLSKSLNCTVNLINPKFDRHPLVCGEFSIFAMMPDWNPAEIIGVAPKPLALSLYKNLITDGIWAYQRSNYGYQNLRGFPLLVDINGLPFIDVRLSFNSLIPASLPKTIIEKLATTYLTKLKTNPELHDKIEFEIVISCYHFSIDSKCEKLLSENFNDDEIKTIKSSLLELTNKIIEPGKGYWLSDIKRFHNLTERRSIIEDSDLPLIDKIYWLLEDCKRYGTLPFAGIARAGFIAMELLFSLEREGLIDADDVSGFLSSVSTINKELSRDLFKLEKEIFLNKYGHLRPGTYDITSERYDASYDHYFTSKATNNTQIEESSEFKLSIIKLRKISNACEMHGINLDAVQLFEFIKQAIEWRERAKFEFTKNVSIALELITEMGASIGLSREELSFIDIHEILKLQSSQRDWKAIFERSIAKGKIDYQATKFTLLPNLISAPENILGFSVPRAAPNFITTKSVSAEITTLEENQDLEGKIVFIPSADPGFDWLFTKNIAGLVTEWGGKNSHMAIRTSELGLPSIIGAGRINYRQWKKNTWMRIDCGAQKVESL